MVSSSSTCTLYKNISVRTHVYPFCFPICCTFPIYPTRCFSLCECAAASTENEIHICNLAVTWLMQTMSEPFHWKYFKYWSFLGHISFPSFQTNISKMVFKVVSSSLLMTANHKVASGRMNISKEKLSASFIWLLNMNSLKKAHKAAQKNTIKHFTCKIILNTSDSCVKQNDRIFNKVYSLKSL